MRFEEFRDKMYALASNSLTSNEEIVKFLITFFSDKPFAHLQYSTSAVARCNFITQGEDINIERCSYPPNPDEIDLQRANFPGQQVMYCSTNSFENDPKYVFGGDYNNHPVHTAIVETIGAKIKTDTIPKIEILLSTWECHRPLKLAVLPFSKKCHNVNPKLKEIYLELLPKIENVMPDNVEAMKSLEFISDCFWTNENLPMHYRITAAFHKAVMFYDYMKIVDLDGLMYPSCHTKGAGINIVLKKETKDQAIITCGQIEHIVGVRDSADPKKLSFNKIKVFNF